MIFNAKKKFVRAAGGAIIEIVVVATAILTGGIGLLILDAVTCDFNVVFTSGCDSGYATYTGGNGGGGGGEGSTVCTSAANSCGMTSTSYVSSCNCDEPAPASARAPGTPSPYGTCSCSGSASIGGGGTTAGWCSATAPPDSQCISPSIGAQGFFASPRGFTEPGGSSTLTWSATNATACSINGDNGFSHTGGLSGSVSTGPLSESTTFTLTCENTPGGPQTSKSLRVIVDTHWEEVDPN